MARKTILDQHGVFLWGPAAFRPFLTEGLALSRTKAESLQEAHKPLEGLIGYPLESSLHDSLQKVTGQVVRLIDYKDSDRTKLP